MSNAESSPDIYSVEQAYASEAGASTMPAFVVSAPSLTFPQTGASESSTLTLQLQSTGAAPLTTAFQTTGDFTETNNCGGELAGYSGAGAYALCTVTLQFIPQATGFRAGTLQIATNAGLQTVTLGGSGPVASGAVPTTTTLLASALSIPAGESETLAVAVIPSSGGVPPTGTVTFYYGNRALGTVAIQSDAAFFTASTKGLPAGSYTVTAQYSGDSTNLASTSAEVAIVVTAGQSATSTSLAASPKTVASGASITLTAIVAKTTGSGQASGAVNFLFGSTLLGSATLSGGTATLTLSSSSFAAGTYSIVADYTGDAADLPSSSAPVTIQIDTNLAATQTVLVATPSTLTQGGQVVLQATVAEVSGSATPTGSIIFAFGSRTLGSSPLFGGIATLTASTGSVPPGNYGIHAIYSGDPANAASASPVVNVTLKAVTATTLSASPTTVAAGQPVNLTATTVETHGSGTPGGSVLFYANGGLLASITVYGGTAIYSAPTSGLPAGSYSITANYSGDGLDAPSVSPPVSVTIQ